MSELSKYNVPVDMSDAPTVRRLLIQMVLSLELIEVKLVETPLADSATLQDVIAHINARSL